MKKNILFILMLISFVSIQAQTVTGTGSMSIERTEHQSEVLPNGNVLVFGGESLSEPGLNTCEIYDPSAYSWSPATPMSFARIGFASAVLPNGNILAIGGIGDPTGANSYPKTCEIYDAATNTWSVTDSMSHGRWKHRAIALQNGNILVVGGNISTTVTEIYNVTTNEWEIAASTNQNSRNYPSLTLLNDGKVLLTGGGGSGIVGDKTAEIYDPIADTWTDVPNLMNENRYKHHTILLDNGKVLISGGLDFSAQDSAELFDPETNTFVLTPPLIGLRANSRSIKLENGHILLFGPGSLFSPGDTKLIEVYNPSSNTWYSNLTYAINGTQGYTIHQLPNNEILALGGNVGGNPFRKAWLIGNLNTSIELLKDNTKLQLYPTPTSNYLTIVSDLNIKKMTIVDINGNPIKTITEDFQIIDVTDLSPSTYFIIIIGEEKAVSKKFVKK